MNTADAVHAEFDSYAQSYEESLNQGLKISGEDSSFFAEHRIHETKRAIDELVPSCGRDKVIDFGCGTGNATNSLQETLGFRQAVGLDVSAGSLAVAAGRFANPALLFETLDHHRPAADADVVFCNGVFHHIPPRERENSVACIHASLKPGGVFAFWENNPWNPGVHFVMHKIPFDRDAKKILPHAAAGLLRRGGFKVLRIRYFFVFPRPLAFLRSLEPALSSLPCGAQYQIIATKEAP